MVRYLEINGYWLDIQKQMVRYLEIDGQIDRNRQVGRQIDRKIDRQKDRWIDRWLEIRPGIVKIKFYKHRWIYKYDQLDS